MTGARSGVWRLGWLGVALAALLGYRDAGTTFYKDFRVPHGVSGFHVPVEELTHLLLFLGLGTGVWIALTIALRDSVIVERLAAWSRPLARRRWACALAVSAALFGASLFVGARVLEHAVVTDDEHVYRFIAQTLGEGALTAPSPGGDLPFFQEQYVVLTERARYGKYPIGHPLLLLAGQRIGLEQAVVPAVTALLAWPVLWIGVRLFGPTAGVLALLLLLMSPQVVLTGGTYLSQPLSALCLLAGLACLLAAEGRSESERPGSSWWLSAAGAAFGYGVLVRPMPGVLFVAAAAAHLLWQRRTQGPRHALQALSFFLLPVGFCMAVLLGINRLQTGSALTTGYHASHRVGEGVSGGVRFLGGSLAQITMSVAGGLLRLNAWAFGWPVGLLVWLWARKGSGPTLLLAMLGAEVAYRMVAPKTVVAGTGPVYFFESVPLLCLLTAGGLTRLARSGRRLLGAPASGGTVVAALVAASVVSLTMFVPYKLRDLERMGAAQRLPLQLAGRQGVHQALVFHSGVVPPWTGLSWAYFPRCNSPRLDDDLLFVRLVSAPDSGLAPSFEFWRRRFPAREAWYFGYFDGKPLLVPLRGLDLSGATRLPRPGP